MTHPLDTAPWSALATTHAHLAQGGERAKRYPAEIVPFAAAADHSGPSLAALAALARPGAPLALLEADPPEALPGLVRETWAEGVQMTREAPAAPPDDPRIVALGRADAEEMLALATLTRPGPFTLRALDLGPFFGIRVDGRLAAMAGERMHLSGFTEVSGVCSHPDFRGLGLAAALTAFVAARVHARGETPFLHAFTSNVAAITLYRSLGFSVRREVRLGVFAVPA